MSGTNFQPTSANHTPIIEPKIAPKFSKSIADIKLPGQNRSGRKRDWSTILGGDTLQLHPARRHWA
jgi:hypothetical protein